MKGSIDRTEEELRGRIEVCRHKKQGRSQHFPVPPRRPDGAYLASTDSLRGAEAGPHGQNQHAGAPGPPRHGWRSWTNRYPPGDGGVAGGGSG